MIEFVLVLPSYGISFQLLWVNQDYANNVDELPPWNVTEEGLYDIAI